MSYSRSITRSQSSSSSRRKSRSSSRRWSRSRSGSSNEKCSRGRRGRSNSRGQEKVQNLEYRLGSIKISLQERLNRNL